MKKKFLFIAASFLVLGIVVIIYSLSAAGFFDKHKLLVRAAACPDCPSHEVIFGSFKLPKQLPDSAFAADVSKVFLIGNHNPDESDYTRTYDYYIITGNLTDVKRVTENGPQYPVISVSDWQEIRIDKVWLSGGLVLLLFILSIYYYRRFIHANQGHNLKVSLMPNEDTPG